MKMNLYFNFFSIICNFFIHQYIKIFRNYLMIYYYQIIKWLLLNFLQLFNLLLKLNLLHFLQHCLPIYLISWHNLIKQSKMPHTLQTINKQPLLLKIYSFQNSSLIQLLKSNLLHKITTWITLLLLLIYLKIFSSLILTDRIAISLNFKRCPKS